MVALEVWYDIKHDDATIVRTPAELDAVLDEVASWKENYNIIELLIADDPVRAILDVGIDVEAGRGTLYYAGEGYDDGCFTRGGSKSDKDLLLYYYMGSDREFPRDSEIPLATVRKAAHEYMTTGGNRPTGIDWQPAR